MEEFKMDLAILILAILYLLGFGVGKVLAICTIVYVGIVTVISTIKKEDSNESFFCAMN